MLPLMLKFYLTCAASSVAVAFIGHFDEDPAHISGALLGKAFSDITGLSVGIGIQLGLNTVISQNHGWKANNENGLAIKQCRRALVFAFIFSCVAAFGSKSVLQALGQPEHVLGPCQNFAIINLLSLPGFWFSASIGGALVNMEITMASVISDTLGAVVNMVMTYVFLAHLNTGYLGAALANVIAGNCAGLATYVYVKFYGLEGDIWVVPPRSADAPPPISLRQYMDIAIPSAFSLWTEWWANQVLAIFAGLLPAGDAAVGGNGIIANMLGIVYMTFVAAQVSTTTRVGIAVGAEDAKRIPVSIQVGVGISFLLSGAAALGLQFGGQTVLGFYTDNAEILGEAISGKLGMVLSIVPYAVMMSLLGALRGAGLQKWGASALAVSFYIIGLPVSAILGLDTELQLLGIWMGNAIGLTVAAVLMGAKILSVNWGKVVGEAANGRDLDAPLADGVATAADRLEN